MKRLIISFTAFLVLACHAQQQRPGIFSVATTTTAKASSALVVAGTIDVQRVRLNVGRLKLESQATGTNPTASTTTASTTAARRRKTDGGTGEVEEVEISQGPFLIDLDAAR